MRTNQSVRQIIGKTNGTQVDTNAQLARAKVLFFLRNQEASLRRKDIASALGMDEERVGSVLQDLSETGAINYSFAIKTGKSVVIYSPNSDFNQDPNSLVTGKGKQEIVAICLGLINSGEAINTEQIRNRLSQEFLSGWKSKRALKNYISSVLSILTHGGFLQKKFFSNEKYSDAGITEKGKLFVDEFLTPLSKLLSDDQEVRNQIALEVIPKINANLTRYIKHSIDLYYPHSSSYMDSMINVNYENIFKAISSTKDYISISDLAKTLGLNRATVGDILRNIGKAFSLKREKRGKVWFYKLESRQSQSAKSQDGETLGFVRRVNTLRINQKDKDKLLTYFLWTQIGSASDLASRMNSTEPAVWQAIEDVNNSESLIQIFSALIGNEDS
jgi:Mn-dependent DtxR family transcriptional regulator